MGRGGGGDGWGGEGEEGGGSSGSVLCAGSIFLPPFRHRTQSSRLGLSHNFFALLAVVVESWLGVGEGWWGVVGWGVGGGGCKKSM